MKKLFLFFLFISLVFTSCNSVKRVGENEHLLTKNSVYVNNTKTSDSKLSELITLKPNSKTLGLPLSLYFYNIGNKNKPQTPTEWGKKNPKSYKFIKNVFSEKQSIAYAKSLIGLNNWFLRNGEAPVVIDYPKIRKSVRNLNTYYKTKGYFQSKVEFDTILNNNKKGTVEYYIETGAPTLLDSITTNIESPILDSIYQLNQEKSFLKKGDIFDQQNFIDEAARITKLFRNNGVYHFSENYIGFYDLDDSNPYFRTNVKLIISGERIVEKDGDYVAKELKIQKLRNINVYTDYTFNDRNEVYLDTVSYNGINFIAHSKVKYNPKLLSESIFIKPNQVYTDTLRNLTRDHLKLLRNFKSTTIQYLPVDGNEEQLDVNILLTPTEKYTLALETELSHSNIRDLGVSGKFSIINRNTFKGAEIFKLSFLGSFFNASQGADQSRNFFNSWEIGADLSLEVPRIVAPFNLGKLVPKKMLPRTYFSLGTSIQKNIGLDRQTVTGLIDYRWNFTPKKTVQLEVFNTQYVKNLRVDNYFIVYNSEYRKLNDIAKIYYNDPNYTLPETGDEPVTVMNLIRNDNGFLTSNPNEYRDNLNILDRYNIITSDFIIPTLAYSFTYNSQTNYKDNNFSFFRVRVANSGNIAGLLSNQRDENGKKTLFNIPLAEYFKIDLEYKKFWDATDNSVFGFRSFIGAIIPYDNSAIPFTKSYFAGGSNDIRAWQTYDLGPGKRRSGLEYNIGSLKFLTSAEYRFDLFGSIKGAFFIDAGNIWDITDNEFTEEEAKFKSLSSLKDIAMGSGFGIRYDLSFLVLRLDLGFKMHEPYLSGNRWFRNYNFSKAVYNIGINYPF